MGKQYVGRWVGVVALSLGAIGCNAQIKAFSAEPRFICPGQEVTLRWGVVGSAKLTVTPAEPGVPTGDVPGQGQVPLHPSVQTRASLHVTRRFGEPAGAETDINIPAPVRVAADLNDPGQCKDGVLTLTAHLSEAQFAPAVRAQVVTVEASVTRSFDITRLGPAQHAITAHVARGVSTTAFANLPMAGDWILSSPLTGQEACPADGKPGNLPHVLTVYAYSSCNGEHL
jgi:hypothetical protein